MRTIKDITLSSNGKRRRVRALFDTGATVNYLTPNIAQEFAYHIAVSDPFKIGLGGKQHLVKEALNLTVRIEEYKMPSQFFHVVDLKKFDAILGAFFMEQWGVTLDPKGKRLKINKEWHELQEEY